jgi:hypothetical protein
LARVTQTAKSGGKFDLSFHVHTVWAQFVGLIAKDEELERKD